MKYYERLYYYGNYIIYFLYFLSFFNIWSLAPSYLSLFQYFFEIFIGISLVVIFNPFYDFSFTNIDKQIAFSAGILLLTSTTIDYFTNQLQVTYKRIKDLKNIFL